MKIFRSNRAEALVQALNTALDRTRVPPLKCRDLVVQSLGMASWLGQQLAKRRGIWANARMWFPRRFFDHVLDQILAEDRPTRDDFDRQRMIWRIFDLLDDRLDDPAFVDVRHYLGNDTQGIKKYQLCNRLARVYDEYLVFRPDMLLTWENNRDPDWQAKLWRALVRQSRQPHFASRVSQLPASRHEADWSAFEHGVFLFGVSALPPVFVRILKAMGQHVPVTLFCLSATDTTSRDSPDRAPGAPNLDPGAEKGHPLLLSMGRSSLDFQNRLLGASPIGEQVTDEFQPSRQRHVLGRLQRDLCLNAAPQPDASDADQDADQPLPSIQINVCHSAWREVEVMYQHLLGLIHSGAVSDPSDIAVLAPKMELYAPLVDAVFPKDVNDANYLPTAIADGKAARDIPVLAAFLNLLDLVDRRVTASDILDFIGKEPMRTHWQITSLDLDRMTAWIRESGIRWGRDADHVRRTIDVDQPSNTWDFGFRRLFLGFAAPNEDYQLFHQVLPFDDIEGEAAQSLGKLSAFTQALFDQLDALSTPKRLSRWRICLEHAVRTMMGQSVTVMDHARYLFDSLDALAHHAERGALSQVAFPVVRQHFLEWSQVVPGSRRILSGGITFGSLLSLQGLPFQVIYVLGMNDRVFPRAESVPSFDKMRMDPQSGDRNSRDDDRLLFLEAMLSARTQLVLSYQGWTAKDNKGLPPSIVVEELLDCLTAMTRTRRHLHRESELRPGQVYQFDDGRLVCHPLHAFDRRYFDPQSRPEFFSYVPAMLRSARRFLGRRTDPSPLISGPLARAAESEHTPIAVADLVRFFDNPTRFLLIQRWGLNLDLDDEVIPEAMSIQTDGLDDYRIGATLLDLYGEGHSVSGAHRILRAQGHLPWGRAGQSAMDRIDTQVQSVMALRRKIDLGNPIAPREIDLDLPSARLSGFLDRQTDLGQWDCRFSRINGRQLLRLWIRHLILTCAHRSHDTPPVSLLIGRNADTKNPSAQLAWFDFIDAPEDLLEPLVQVFLLGQKIPLMFLPNSAHAFAQMEHAGKNGSKAAQGSWKTEAADPHVQRVFGDSSAFDPYSAPIADVDGHACSFARLATCVFFPLLENVKQAADLEPQSPSWFLELRGQT